MIMRPGAILVLIAGMALRGQQPPDAIFRTTTRLVQVSVIAQDKQGKPILDLRREEFQVFDNGAPQDIQLFVAETQKPALASPEAKLPADTYTNQLAPAPTGVHTGYSIILFDNLVSDFGDPISGSEGTGFGVQKVLTVLRSLPEGERIAIYALGRRLQVVREFTADRDSLEQHLHSWKPSTDDAKTGTGLCPSGNAPEGLAGIAISDSGPHTNEAAVACVSGDMAIRVAAMKEELKQIADHVAGIAGRKNLIWMANLFPLAGGEAIQKLMDAGVAIYPVDENGVYAPTPTQGAMQALARLTGGVAYSKRNDLDLAVQEAVEDGRASYTLGFYDMSDPKKAILHGLQVRVSRPGVTLRYRAIYQSEPPPPKPASPVAELVNAMNRPMDATVIPIAAHAVRTQDRLDLRVSFDLSGLGLTFQQGLWKGRTELVARFLTADGTKAGDVVSHTVVFNLRPATYQAMLQTGAPYSRVLTIPAKAVELKLLVGSVTTGKIGTLTIPLPEPPPPPKRNRTATVKER